MKRQSSLSPPPHLLESEKTQIFSTAKPRDVKNMGSGKPWNELENEMWARAWITAFEDTVVGNDQRSNIFYKTVHRRFIGKVAVLKNGVERKYSFQSVGRI